MLQSAHNPDIQVQMLSIPKIQTFSFNCLLIAFTQKHLWNDFEQVGEK